MEYVLRTFALSKKYKNHYALNQASMNIQKGDIYGFVGENGSGKTTIIRLITGLISATSGCYELFGVSNNSPDILKARRKVGAIVETPSIYQNMSARDNLKMQCDIIGIKDENKIKEALFDVGLIELYDNPKKVGNFSLGMRQRLGIAMALLGEPEFLILDEPMNGLDPAGIVEVRELIIKLNREKNITFLISSHILTELALVATKYGIISKGHIVREISAEELRHEFRKSTVIEVNDPYKLSQILPSFVSFKDISLLPTGAKIFGDIDLNLIFEAVIKAGITIISVNCNEANIEDFYLSIAGGIHHD
ncbi:MAG: ATP-binding cassette domain-containing protein [Clostridia bacterium]|nr:ATP-binding cassette domain-containing protein [Clostridia bacterium]